jgi:hypothetical protein
MMQDFRAHILHHGHPLLTHPSTTHSNGWCSFKFLNAILGRLDAISVKCISVFLALSTHEQDTVYLQQEACPQGRCLEGSSFRFSTSTYGQAVRI